MTMLHAEAHSSQGLPDPDYDTQMYRDVPSKRLIAWVLDVVLITIITAFLTIFTAFTALFFLPFFYAMISFLVRWITLSGFSATPGMQVMAIGLRNRQGQRLTSGEAFLHTAGYFVSFAVFPLQLVSVAMMLLNERNQGLSDLLLGTAALNRASN